MLFVNKVNKIGSDGYLNIDSERRRNKFKSVLSKKKKRIQGVQLLSALRRRGIKRVQGQPRRDPHLKNQKPTQSKPCYRTIGTLEQRLSLDMGL
ncbi:rCG35722, isoform CRA_b [Rattus norvegicus]|uniref:RCG35722, isoform CRA_b n=1 Tax=Rattus norvegicus TaxID=10116 RepID=A6IKP1_RAT|nr:rCG35722, isoform CRA_b [Rattus norvegicus]